MDDATAQRIDAFTDWLWLSDGLARRTCEEYNLDLRRLDSWLREQGSDLDRATTEDLSAVFAQRHGQLGPHAQRRYIAALQRYYTRRRQAEGVTDPIEQLMRPKLPPRVPKALSPAQVEALLVAPDVETPKGLRDKAMLELAYASGLRVSELVALPTHHLDLNSGVVKVAGKGDKERLVPVGEVAVEWLERYIAQRPRSASPALFLNRFGKAMTRQAFWQHIKHYATVAGLPAVLVSPHVVRHSFATHLHNNGADLRVLQLLLGHSDIDTTTVYLQVARQHLHEVHKQHHPRG